MCEQHRLRTLHVGVTRHHDIGVLFRDLQQRGNQICKPAGDFDQLSLGPEAEVVGNLIVARAASMKPTSRRADELAQSLLDAGVDILIGNGEVELAGLNLTQDLPETGDDGFGILFGDHVLLAQHAGVGDGGADIFPNHTNIEANGSIERLQAAIRILGKSTTPRLARTYILSHRHHHPCTQIDAAGTRGSERIKVTSIRA